MKIFITGASGFIGRNLLPKLIEEGHEIIVYNFSSTFIKDNYKDSLIIIDGDLSLGQGLDNIIWEDIDIVIHLASAGAKVSTRSWYKCIYANIMATEQLIGSLNKMSVPPLLIYPKTFYEDYINDYSDLKNNPYVITKSATTNIVELYAQNNKNARIVIANIFQAYGPSDNPKNVLTYTVDCLKKGERAKLGSGKGYRDWIFIADLVDAFLHIINNPGDRIQYFDLGTGELASIKEVVTIISELLNRPKDILDFDSQRDRGDIDIRAYAKNIPTHWESSYSIKAGILELINS